MADQELPNQQPTENETPAPQPAVRAPQADLSIFKKVERVTAWVLMLSAVLFAVIGIAAIWGVFGDNGDAVWRSLGSLAVVALAAAIINVGARMAEDRK